MAERRILAVLFADVSGSTRLYERLGDQLALAVIGKCLGVMEQATKRHQGHVVKTIGDEVMAVFASATAAHQAAVDMQIGVCELPEAAEHRLTIHCGFHFGEVMVADRDVFGDTVNVAARLAEVSKSGQIITSGEVIRSLPQALASRSRFIDIEAVKGRAAPLELFEVLWESDEEVTALASDQLRSAPRKAVMMLRYRGHQYELSDANGAVTLGRDARSDMVIIDKLVSRNHSRIEKSRDKFTYVDFSSNGSYVRMLGQQEMLVRRDSIVLQDRGTISFGRPVSEEPAAAVYFEIAFIA
ncbi:MAG: adenylate/guanylate cyclase domain-containing protein [Acetobacteraceae bacterium]|nr:adenylate/guanylate cyclase domain-containing protein [Acetobacteraceae bacterium]